MLHLRYVFAYLAASCAARRESTSQSAGVGVPEPMLTYGDVLVTVLMFLPGPLLMLGFVQGQIVKMSIARGGRERAFGAQMDAFNEYARSKMLPAELKDRCILNLDYRWRTGKHLVEDDLISVLPSAVRAQVLLHMTKELLDAVPGICDLSHAACLSLASRLTPEYFAPGDRLVVQGMRSEFLFLISRGRVELAVGEERVSALEAGSYCGDLGTLLDVPSPCSAIAVTFVETYGIHRDHLHAVLADVPEVEEVIQALFCGLSCTGP